MNEPVHARTSDGEITAAFLVDRVKRRRGRLWDEGARRSAFITAAPAGSALHLLATRRVRGISEAVVRGVLAWDAGLRPADRLDVVPTAHEILSRQARGRRCVSLVSDEIAAAHGDPRHIDGLSFVLHDLEHLEKFVEPAHYIGQIGFFKAVRRALMDPLFVALESSWDAAWRADRNYIISDMNGSAIFLFSVLKMKVKMAVRRQLARTEGRISYARGPLDDSERAAALPALEVMVDALGLPERARRAALAVSARRDHPDDARALLAGFEAVARPWDYRGDDAPGGGADAGAGAAGFVVPGAGARSGVG